MAELPEDGATRSFRRRTGNVAGDCRNLVEPRHRRIQMDRNRPGAGDDYRSAARRSGDDRRTTTDGAEPRVRRAVRDTGWNRGVLSADAGCAALHDGGALTGGHSRFADVYREFDGRGKSAGTFAAAADYLQGAEPRQSRTAGRGDRHRGNVGGTSRKGLSLSIHCGHTSFVWCD